MRHADIRKTMNIHGQAIEKSKREAHESRAARFIFSGGLRPLAAPENSYVIEEKEDLVGAVAMEFQGLTRNAKKH